MENKPVRPRHAASLVLTRQLAGEPHVLMGRRPARAVFPEAWVFPGGRLDPGDRRIAPSAPLSAATMTDLCNRGGCTPAMAQGLATTAIRETFEETGLLLAGSGNPGSENGTWAAFARAGLAPAHDRLRFLGRAITPTSAPVRFHARFFLADGDDLTGALRSNGELLDLDWYPLARAREFHAVDVTRFVLAELAEMQAGATRTAPFFRYRRNKPVPPA
jgi:8-oxo-dGTP pyrophosphatase MutT (NUDIX family)